MKAEKGTILFYLGHPAHYHNISVVAKKLSEKGYKILLVARAKDVLFDLLQDLPCEIVYLKPRRGKGKLSLIATVLKRELVLYRLAKKHDILLMMGTDIAIAHIGKLLKIPSIILNEDDAKEVPFMVKYGYRYATAILAPECCDCSPYNHKKVGYNGYHELAYLHPKYFTPNKSQVLEAFGSEKYFMLRFAELTAHHDKGKKGIDLALAKQIVDKLTPFGRVYISSERKLESELEPFRIKIDPRDLHNTLNFAHLYIGDSQTMAAEAAVLGTPSIRYNDFVGRLSYLEELEHKYNLTSGIKVGNSDELLNKIDELLKDDGLIERYQKRKEEMLNQTIDVAAFWENYVLEMVESKVGANE